MTHGPTALLDRKIEQLEYDFDGTISEILAGFAQDGESVTATARALDISPQVVRRMATELGIIDAFPHPWSSNARKAASASYRRKGEKQ